MQMDDMIMVSGISPSVATFKMKDGAPVGSMAGPGELAAPPHVVTGEGLPMVVLVSRDLTQGTIVRAVTRSIEPQVLPMTPLPNPVAPPAPPAGPTEADHPAETDRATEGAVMP